MNQYGYTLYDADGATVDTGVTDKCSVSFEGLRTDAPYSFELRVYGEYGETSYHTTISTRTLPIRQLDTPQPTVSQDGSRVVLTWPAVEGAASYLYTYTIGDNELSGVTEGTSCSIAGLAPGKHSISLMAVSDYGGYTDSKTVTVEAVRSRTETATVQGTYTSGLIRRNNSWPATLHIYSDGTFVIESFYQAEGYNLDIYVDTDPATGENFLGIYNFVSYPECQYYLVDTGRASAPQIEITTGLSGAAYCSSFTGNATSGSLSFNTRYQTASGTDTFQW